MHTPLYIDLETRSSVDLKKHGVYNYTASLDFEILIVAYALGNGPVKSFCPWRDGWPSEFTELYYNDAVELWAFNAAFERLCFAAVGMPLARERWRCSSVYALYFGLPGRLSAVSKALNLGGDAKDVSAGTRLIKKFSVPQKDNSWIDPAQEPEDFAAFVEYCCQDVVAERAIHKTVGKDVPEREWRLYWLDQKINDFGIPIDIDLARSAAAIKDKYKSLMRERMKTITNLPNPNSLPQLKGWLTEQTGREITSLTKDDITEWLDEDGVPAHITEVLIGRLSSGKTSIGKFDTALDTVSPDLRARGQFQFYGANRTGRFSGRGIQPQNLPRNSDPKWLEYLHDTLTLSASDFIEKYDKVNYVLTQVLRPMFKAPDGMVFVSVDFSAIEARVTAHLAGEQWRIDTFNSHGKIYEASAAAMYGVPIESITKDSPLRQQGKIAELALGYGGGVNALNVMDKTNSLGMDEVQKQKLVDTWRAASPSVVSLWYSLEDMVRRALATPGKRFICEGAGFRSSISAVFDGRNLILALPSGRDLYYISARLRQGKFGKPEITYLNPNSNGMSWVSTWGGKLTENVVQAFSRDLLGDNLLRVDALGYDIPIHVHDELIALVPDQDGLQVLYEIIELMSVTPEWAGDLTLKAAGYYGPRYKKD